MKLFGKGIRRRNAEQEPSEAVEAELTPRQQTLFIGAFVSACGNCLGNADLHEESHVMETMEGEGCGVTWKYVASDMPGKDYSGVRPDLIPVEMDLSIDGITNQMEDRILGNLAVFEAYLDPDQ